MKIKYIEKINDYVSENESLSDVTIGFFDGVHLGHQKLINYIEKSSKIKTIITFDSHPNKEEIMDINYKLKIFEKFQIDQVLVIKMNQVNSYVSAKEFVEFLKKININQIFVGSDFHFGRNAQGNVDYLKEDFNVVVIDFLLKNQEKISSTKLRKALEIRNLEQYKELAGRNYTVLGKVITGNQIGRTIDFPTANLDTEKILIGNGVYLTQVTCKGKKYDAITNVGRQPTVNGQKIKIESHIIDFNDIIYNINIEVEFIKLLRDEQKFNSLEELKAQIEKDKIKAKEYYGNKRIN